jgi:hypothetical protein
MAVEFNFMGRLITLFKMAAENGFSTMTPGEENLFSFSFWRSIWFFFLLKRCVLIIFNLTQKTERKKVNIICSYSIKALLSRHLGKNCVILRCFERLIFSFLFKTQEKYFLQEKSHLLKKWRPKYTIMAAILKRHIGKK